MKTLIATLALCFMLQHAAAEDSVKDSFRKIGGEFKSLGKEIGKAGSEIGKEATKVGKQVAKESKTVYQETKGARSGLSEAFWDFTASVKSAWKRFWD
jgi:hypothetical protein